MIMLNEYFLIQFLIIVIIIFINTSSNLLYTLLHSIVYLLLLSIYAWLNDYDVLINFLIIIDLGIFLILLAFIFNSLYLYNNDNNRLINSRTIIHLYVYMFICMIIQIWYTWMTVMVMDYIQLCEQYFIIYYNWYSILQLTYFSDLQFLSEIYFHFNLVEFIIMNILLFITVIAIFMGLNIWYLAKIYQLIKWFQTNFYYSYLHSDIFFRYQDMQNQILIKGHSRVWSKNINK